MRLAVAGLTNGVFKMYEAQEEAHSAWKYATGAAEVVKIIDAPPPTGMAAAIFAS